MIRADGYHILADATGVPDLYAHIGPTLRRLLPGHRPRAVGADGPRARCSSRVGCSSSCPVLLSLMLGAVLLLPRLLDDARGRAARAIAVAHPARGRARRRARRCSPRSCGCSRCRCPCSAACWSRSGSCARVVAQGARAGAPGGPARRVVLVAAAAAVVAGARGRGGPPASTSRCAPTQGGTLAGFAHLVAAPAAAARPRTPARRAAQLAPGTHLAVAMIPRRRRDEAASGAVRHPRRRRRAGRRDLSRRRLDPASTPAATTRRRPRRRRPRRPAAVTRRAGRGDARSRSSCPARPGPGDTQALAVGTKDGGVNYDVAYALVTVSDGAPVTNTNSAFAFAHCKACTTVAVSFQVVLVVGQSNDDRADQRGRRAQRRTAPPA